MSPLFVTVLAVAVIGAFAAPQHDIQPISAFEPSSDVTPIAIIDQTDSNNGDGTFSYRFDLNAKRHYRNLPYSRSCSSWFTATKRATASRPPARDSSRRSSSPSWTKTARRPARRKRRKSLSRPDPTRTQRPTVRSSPSTMWPTRTASSPPAITSQRRQPFQSRSSSRCNSNRLQSVPKCV